MTLERERERELCIALVLVHNFTLKLHHLDAQRIQVRGQVISFEFILVAYRSALSGFFPVVLI